MYGVEDGGLDVRLFEVTVADINDNGPIEEEADVKFELGDSEPGNSGTVPCSRQHVRHDPQPTCRNDCCGKDHCCIGDPCYGWNSTGQAERSNGISDLNARFCLPI